MFGFLKKAVGGLIDGVKKKLESKPVAEEEIEEKGPAVEENIEDLTESPIEPEKAEEKPRPIPAPAEEAVAPLEEGKNVPSEIRIGTEPAEIPEETPAAAPVLETPAEPEEREETLDIPVVEAATVPVPQELPSAIVSPRRTEIVPPKAAEPPLKVEAEPEAVEVAPSPKMVPAPKTPVRTKVEEKPKAAEIVVPQALEPKTPLARKMEELAISREGKTKAAVPPKKAAPVEAAEEEPGKRTGLLGKLLGGVKKAAKTIVRTVQERTIAEDDVSDFLWNFQIQLIQANVASEVAEKICDRIRRDLVGSRVKRTEDIGKLIVASLRSSILGIVGKEAEPLEETVRRKKPFLMVFLGFNGTGKTTTIAKIANLLKQKGISCVIAAGDTFRAAAVEQAEVHGDRLGVKVIKQQYGADAAAVVFDAMKYAQAKGVDVVLADTAGRQHTNVGLMEELKKICRVNKPDMKVLVIDSLSGSDTVLQAKEFDRVVGGVDGVVLTKVDVDEKGGAAISVAHTIGKPILFLGMGQEYGELKRFVPEEYVEMLLS